MVGPHYPRVVDQSEAQTHSPQTAASLALPARLPDVPGEWRPILADVSGAARWIPPSEETGNPSESQNESTQIDTIWQGTIPDGDFRKLLADELRWHLLEELAKSDRRPRNWSPAPDGPRIWSLTISGGCGEPVL